MSIMTSRAKAERLATLAELVSIGVPVTICKPGKAKGVRKQVMRAKGSGGFVTGGSAPASVKASSWG